MSFLKPTKHVKETRWNKQVICFYGNPGVGKSTMASFFEKEEGYAYIATEPGYNHLDLNNSPLKAQNYKDFIDGLKQLIKLKADGDSPYKGVIIDTTSEWFKFIVDMVCTKNGINDIGDLPRGAGYTEVRNKAIEIIKKIREDLDMGLVLISHSKPRPKEKMVGLRKKEWEQADLMMSERESLAVVAQCDLVVYMTTNTEEHESTGLAYTKPGDYQIAKDRIKDSTIPYEIKFNPANTRELYDELRKHFD